LKKGDFLIFLSVIALIILSLGVLFVLKGGSADTVLIKQNNEIVYEDKLYKDKTVNLDGNKIRIENSKVFMEEASCANQICVRSKAIGKVGESIICLPNKVIIEIR